jgi:hypothetical protein
MSLDASAFVDTSNWVGELGLSSAQHASHATQPKKKSASTPPANKPHRAQHPTPSPAELDSLEQILEPEKTGMHGRPGSTPWLLIAIVMLVLAAGAAAAVVFMMQ